MAFSIVPLAAPLPAGQRVRTKLELTGEFNFFERLTEKFSQAHRFRITDKLSVEEITSAFGGHSNPKILVLFLSILIRFGERKCLHEIYHAKETL